ncbi:uncharacterized protein ARMOST_13651 [Armillaria ostoyae]|uniref:Uncharacterized protein n=1 Tax=Armillaria ostoyae TaxID=47428 RepID=A0A284RNC9_ARMOS|nr:uncharacterized protein ARMOST_13651 [Armillaria ostoyae]
MPDIAFAYLALLILPASMLVGLAVLYFRDHCCQHQQPSYARDFPLHQITFVDPYPLPAKSEDEASNHSAASSTYSFIIPDKIIDTTRPTTPASTYKCSSLTEFRASIHSDFIQGSSRDLVTRPDSLTLPQPEAVLVLSPHLRNLPITPPPTYPPPKPPVNV